MKGQFTYYLNDFFKYIVVAGRFGGLIAFMPGYSDSYIPNRVKIISLVAFTIALTPILPLDTVKAPTSLLPMATLIIGEILVGYFFALMVRFIIGSVDIAGTIMGFQFGLSNVFTMSTTSAQQSALLSTFLTMIVVLILFITDLHFLIIKTLIDSYSLFKPGHLIESKPVITDLFMVLSDVLAKSLLLSLQLAAPFIMVSLFLTLAGAIINRVIPQIQIFFVLQPAQLALGFIVLALTLGVLMQHVHDEMESTFHAFSLGKQA